MSDEHVSQENALVSVTRQLSARVALVNRGIALSERLLAGRADVEEALSPSLQLAVKLLASSASRLSEFLYREIAENPMLQEISTSGEQSPEKATAPQSQSVIVPDVFIVKVEGNYAAVLNHESLPRLRISPPAFEKMRSSETDDETRAYLKDKFRSAHWLMKVVELRQRTVQKVATCIVSFQKEFFDSGDIEHLRPLSLRDVAVACGLHESLNLSVVTNRYMHTPLGVIEMRDLLCKPPEVQASRVATETRDFTEVPASKELFDSDDGRMLLEPLEEISAETLAKQGEKAPLIKLVNVVLVSAVEKGASHIHIEPYEKELRVRFRIDGLLYNIMSPPLKFRDAITACIKEMSKLDIEDQRRPQQGRIEARFRDNGLTTDIDFLVSSQPTVFGEKIVISVAAV
jgi:type II secretory ATPase GspE/PulE/Tfp pilus assembly ATPase PilB-like protein